MAQIKFNVDDELAKKFRQAVLSKNGKLQVSHEGEEALKLYLKMNNYQRAAKRSRGSKDRDPIFNVIGVIRSRGRPDALKELKKLEEEGEP